MQDTKSEVATTAEKTGVALCHVLTNPGVGASISRTQTVEERRLIAAGTVEGSAMQRTRSGTSAGSEHAGHQERSRHHGRKDGRRALPRPDQPGHAQERRNDGKSRGIDLANPDGGRKTLDRGGNGGGVTKSEVATTAEKTGVALCHVLTNPDIQPFVPDLVRSRQGHGAGAAKRRQESGHRSREPRRWKKDA
jgi:hypothetical protein